MNLNLGMRRKTKNKVETDKIGKRTTISQAETTTKK